MAAPPHSWKYRLLIHIESISPPLQQPGPSPRLKGSWILGWTAPFYNPCSLAIVLARIPRRCISSHRYGAGERGAQDTRHQVSEGRIPGKLPEQKGLGSPVPHAIWTQLVILHPKMPLVSPGDAKNGMIPVLRGTPSTRGCEQLIPTLVWGKMKLRFQKEWVFRTCSTLSCLWKF